MHTIILLHMLIIHEKLHAVTHLKKGKAIADLFAGAQKKRTARYT